MTATTPIFLEVQFISIMEKHTVISVGRQFGSGGKSVAEALGALMGIPVYDNELIARAAEESGFNPELFRRSDEKMRIFGFGTIMNSISDEDLFNIQSKVISDIASAGNAIFVGRASDYVLRDMKECLSVFISAPMADRKKRISERMALSREEAEKLIIKMDRGRENYYNFFTFGHWGVASTYDLCLDSSVLGIEGTADMIREFVRRVSAD